MPSLGRSAEIQPHGENRKSTSSGMPQLPTTNNSFPEQQGDELVDALSVGDFHGRFMATRLDTTGSVSHVDEANRWQVDLLRLWRKAVISTHCIVL
jgi:hypothetical protein